MFCPACGREQPPDARFCPGCGREQAAVGATRVPPAPMPFADEEPRRGPDDDVELLASRSRVLTRASGVALAVAALIYIAGLFPPYWDFGFGDGRALIDDTASAIATSTIAAGMLGAGVVGIVGCRRRGIAAAAVLGMGAVVVPPQAAEWLSAIRYGYRDLLGAGFEVHAVAALVAGGAAVVAAFAVAADPDRRRSPRPFGSGLAVIGGALAAASALLYGFSGSGVPMWRWTDASWSFSGQVVHASVLLVLPLLAGSFGRFGAGLLVGPAVSVAAGTVGALITVADDDQFPLDPGPGVWVGIAAVVVLVVTFVVLLLEGRETPAEAAAVPH